MSKETEEILETEQEELRAEEPSAKEEEGNAAEAREGAEGPEEGAGTVEEGAPGLEQELAAKTAELEELHNRYIRLQADFDNFRRRTREEREQLLAYASEGVVTALLPVLDNFERALKAAQSNKDGEALMAGVEMIFKQLGDVLAQAGLQAIEAVGSEFDPNLHNAVMQGEADETYPDNTVMEELQKGYKLKDKVIRPSMVKVARG